MTAKLYKKHSWFEGTLCVDNWFLTSSAIWVMKCLHNVAVNIMLEEIVSWRCSKHATVSNNVNMLHDLIM